MRVKKVTALLLAGAMCLSLLAGCGNSNTETQTPAQDTAGETGREEKQERERAVKENKAAALNGMQESIGRMEAMLAQEKQSNDIDAALQKELRLLRMQLKRVMAAETISVEANTMRSERTVFTDFSGLRKPLQ